MQDRYVGDIGDFGKYALLKALAGEDLRLGVHWYRNADEEANTDGRFTEYAHLRACDPALHDTLNEIVRSGCRSVTTVENANILPKGTLFYSSPLTSRKLRGTERLIQREAWNAEAMRALGSAVIVFMDPDNGFSSKGRSVTLSAGRAPKYVFPDELRPYVKTGQRLVVYHHQTREPGGIEQILRSKSEMLRTLGFEDVWALVFRRVSVRIYFVLPAPSHVAILRKRSLDFLSTEWGRGGHFTFETGKTAP